MQQSTRIRGLGFPIALCLVASGVAVLNFGGAPLSAASQECESGGQPTSSPTGGTGTASPTGGGPGLPPVPPILPTASSSTSATSSPTGGTSRPKTTCDSDVTIRYSDARNRFSGAVRSDENACERGRQVLLKKDRRGTRDRTVDSTLTTRRGTWKIGHRNPEGRFYARVTQTSKRAANGGRVECNGARSRTIRP